MRKFRFILFSLENDAKVMEEYIREEVLPLYLDDNESNGFNILLNAITNGKTIHGDTVVEFQMNNVDAHKVMQWILHDVDELYPYITDSNEETAYYYNCKVCTMLHVVRMMMNSYTGVIEQ